MTTESPTHDLVLTGGTLLDPAQAHISHMAEYPSE